MRIKYCNKLKIKKLSIILIIIVLVIFELFRFIMASRLNAAIWDSDEEMINSMLSNNIATLYVDSYGTDRFSVFPIKPFERALSRNINKELTDKFVESGAKFKNRYLYYLVNPLYIDSKEKIQLFLDNGLKLNIHYKNDDISLLDSIAGDTIKESIDAYDVEYKEWENYILETYKLVYFNAQPFDKEKELKSSLKLAKQAKNKLLIKFIESQLAKIK